MSELKMSDLTMNDLVDGAKDPRTGVIKKWWIRKTESASDHHEEALAKGFDIITIEIWQFLEMMESSKEFAMHH